MPAWASLPPLVCPGWGEEAEASPVPVYLAQSSRAQTDPSYIGQAPWGCNNMRLARVLATVRAICRATAPPFPLLHFILSLLLPPPHLLSFFSHLASLLNSALTSALPKTTTKESRSLRVPGQSCTLVSAESGVRPSH